MDYSLEILDGLRQVHEPPALRVDRLAGVGELSHRLTDRDVGAERAGVEFGVSTTEVEAVDVGQDRIRLGTPKTQLGPSGPKPIEIFGVVKLERGVARDCDPDAGPLELRHRSPTGVTQGDGDRDQLIKIDEPLDSLRKPSPEFRSQRALGSGDEAEMALW